MKNYVSYLRVSTQKQGKSGLGIEAQRKMCEDFVSLGNGKICKEFVDVESGTHRDRPGLWEAIDFCKKNDCALVIAKLDRLARDVEFTFKVINTGIEIHFTDMPAVNTMILGVFASVAQYERELVSTRTKQALGAKKARGEKVGAACDKWQATRNGKTEVQLSIEQNKRAMAKRENFLHARDTQNFIKVLQRVFKEACKGSDFSSWDWKVVNTKGENKVKMIEAMKDIRDMSPDGSAFAKWNFDDNMTTLQVKLATTIKTLYRSVTK